MSADHTDIIATRIEIDALARYVQEAEQDHVLDSRHPRRPRLAATTGNAWPLGPPAAACNPSSRGFPPSQHTSTAATTTSSPPTPEGYACLPALTAGQPKPPCRQPRLSPCNHPWRLQRPG